MIATYIKGDNNLIADKLSRLHIGDSWKLNPDVFAMIQSMTIPFTIDRFACKANSLLGTYNSYFYEPLSNGVDAFA
jgi:hypothetical protein